MPISDYCQSLLKQSLVFHPAYGDRMANHLPMALIALDKMGASPLQLDNLYQHYRTRLQLLDINPAPAINPSNCLGDTARFENFLSYFKASLAHKGREAVLTQWVPILTPGLVASAFHALIRLAYALEAGLDAELAMALAYWASVYQPLGPLANDSTAPALTATALANSLALAHQARGLQNGIIADKIDYVSQWAVFTAGCPQPAQLTLRGLQQFSATAYLSSDHFTLLHAVTATHAFRLLMPYQANITLALKYHWQALLAAYLSTGIIAGELPPLKEAAIDWPALFTQASAASNDHQIKLTYTCWQEYQATGDAYYAHIARQANSPTPKFTGKTDGAQRQQVFPVQRLVGHQAP